MSIETILPDNKIESVWGNANFGSSSTKREIVDMALLKTACGYSNGHTAEFIVTALGLVDSKLKLTKLGKEYLYESFEKIKNF